MNCVYLGEPIGRKRRGVFGCQLHGRCVLRGGDESMPGCDECPDRLPLGDPKFADEWRDGLTVTDRRGLPTDALRDLLAGRPAFLVGGGPSANDLPLEDLNRRGVFSFCINNVAAHPRFRPQAFVCSDPPSKFQHSIWFDPQVMKFVPTPKLLRSRGKLKRKMPDGTFVRLKERTADCPNTWGFQRQSWMTPDDRFFLDSGAMWGNLNSGVKRTGQPKTVCTMLLGLRLLRYLGARRIYLVGVDFRMQPDWGYSFGQARTDDACRTNNRQFSVVNTWLCDMQGRGVFERFGVELYNCYARSGLRAFPYVPFADALADVRGICEDEPDTSLWYEKVKTEEEKKKEENRK